MGKDAPSYRSTQYIPAMKKTRSVSEMINIVNFCKKEIERLHAEHEYQKSYNPEATLSVTAVSNYRATITRMEKKIAKASK
jgi:hypothetical protein